ncbi:hypothetical protein GCM10010954_25400 [Halobacillus andaensis]|uniref:histidine kinase n=1 Tax=Halobacillus andaensis TaxID=1176239 RepID=A0A917B5N3_HALAA|nr:ATP-binding protein [Halobacillus andaensis]MBP2005873.1 two-component system sensor histidine kinase BaeS [Halobacillus andaensis]GGF25419.1 hypothetical protein GCM10010954_25400 [Halobacillus andaensis]
MEFKRSRLWVKLTFLNVLLLVGLVLFSVLTVYTTACYLASDIGGIQEGRQLSFNSSLLTYSWLISAFVILIGGVLYAITTKRMLRPVKDLKSAMEKLKTGNYPESISSQSNDEIGELVGHFNHLIVMLQKQEEERNRILGDMSHELRTPLSNLKGYLEALNKGFISGNQEIYKLLAEETERVTGLVQQVELVKEWDKSSHPSLEKESIQVKELIEQVVQLFEWELEQKKVPVKYNIEEVPLPLHREGMQQVLTNLMDNAIAYHKGADPIVIKGEALHEEYIISFSGEGQFIPIEEKDKVFDRFYRVDTARSREEGGTGLGLAISKEIMERHEGTLELQTNGYYHTFVVKIPIK